MATCAAPRVDIGATVEVETVRGQLYRAVFRQLGWVYDGGGSLGVVVNACCATGGAILGSTLSVEACLLVHDVLFGEVKGRFDDYGSV